MEEVSADGTRQAVGVDRRGAAGGRRFGHAAKPDEPSFGAAAGRLPLSGKEHHGVFSAGDFSAAERGVIDSSVFGEPVAALVVANTAPVASRYIVVHRLRLPCCD